VVVISTCSHVNDIHSISSATPVTLCNSKFLLKINLSSYFSESSLIAMELEDYSSLANHEEAYFRNVVDLSSTESKMSDSFAPSCSDVIMSSGCSIESDHVTDRPNQYRDIGDVYHVTTPISVISEVAYTDEKLVHRKLDFENPDSSGDGYRGAESDVVASTSSSDALRRFDLIDVTQPEVVPCRAEPQSCSQSAASQKPEMTKISAKFEAIERAFRDEFFPSTSTSSTGCCHSIQDKAIQPRRSSPALSTAIPDDNAPALSSAITVTGSSDTAIGMRQLICLLSVLEQLAATRSCNRRLQRKCDLLADGQELLRAQNRMLLASATRRAKATKTSSSAIEMLTTSARSHTPSRYQEYTDSSSEMRRRDRTFHHRGTVSTGTNRLTMPTPHRLLSYTDGSSGVGRTTVDKRCSKSAVGSGADRVSSSGSKLQRSWSMGSINAKEDSDAPDLNDVELSATGRNDTTDVDQTMTSSANSTSCASGSRREQKKTRKLQEKWEQVYRTLFDCV